MARFWDVELTRIWRVFITPVSYFTPAQIELFKLVDYQIREVRLFVLKSRMHTNITSEFFQPLTKK
ncbi:MAG: hypothetical protein C5S47_00100 [Candidatus Methanogasteraceae archaeon]|nr:MAG: hypothetical protein C5S47_00100 [ANME-2 cluster archaeon]